MTSTTTNTIGKVAALAAGFAIVAMSFASIVPAAHADTTTTTSSTMTSSQVAALQAQIASLQAQLSAASGSSASASVMFNTNLTIGSKGSDVTALQNWLIAKGFAISAGATGYFGGQTKAALAAYQSANGISPAVGYFGPITRAKVNAAGGSTTTTTTTTTTTGAGCVAGAAFSSTTGQACTTTTTGTGTTTLAGGEGTINNFQTIGATNLTLNAGATQQVYGFQFMAGGSDLRVDRIYFDLSNPTTSGTTRPWNVFKTATLTDASGNTVATLDASNQNNYSQDGTLTSGAGTGNQVYRLAFQNLPTVVKMNASQTYFLTLTTSSAYATGNVVSGTTAFTVGLASQGLRATDAMGIQEYTGTAAASTVTLSTNSSGTVVISTGTDNPQTTTLLANQNTSTSNVVLNTFTLQNQGTVGVQLFTLPVVLSTASTSGGSNTLLQSSSLVQSLMLYQGSTLLDTESPASTFVSGSGSSITFKNLNYTIPAGTTSSFRIVAVIQPVGGSNAAPSQAAATVTVNSTTGVDIETPGGSIINSASGLSGSSTGYPIAFAINGLSVASAPTSAVATAALTSSNAGSQQTGTFTFVFNVTAFGQTIYVASTSNAYALTINDQTTGTATSSTNITSGITSTANRSGLGNFQVNSGQTAAFTVTATLSHGGSNHYFYAVLNSLVYGTADNAATTATTTLPSNYTTNAVAISS